MVLVVFQYFFCYLTFTPKSDQDRISSHGNDVTAYRALRYKYSIKQAGDENKEKILIMGLLVDPIPNSLNYHHENCMADSKEHYQ